MRMAKFRQPLAPKPLERISMKLRVYNYFAGTHANQCSAPTTWVVCSHGQLKMSVKLKLNFNFNNLVKLVVANYFSTIVN